MSKKVVLCKVKESNFPYKETCYDYNYKNKKRKIIINVLKNTTRHYFIL